MIPFLLQYGWLILPILIAPLYYYYTRGMTIENRVEFFFKGGTKAYYPCTIKGSTIEFKVDETEYKIPILYPPRIETVGRKTYRTYLVAEGGGYTLGVPPLKPEDEKKIREWLEQEGIVEDASKLTSEDLKKYYKVYQFDIEQILDRPIPRAFSVSISAYESHIQSLMRQLQALEKPTSKAFILALGLVGWMIGFFMAYSLALKGVI